MIYNMTSNVLDRGSFVKGYFLVSLPTVDVKDLMTPGVKVVISAHDAWGNTIVSAPCVITVGKNDISNPALPMGYKPFFEPKIIDETPRR